MIAHLHFWYLVARDLISCRWHNVCPRHRTPRAGRQCPDCLREEIRERREDRWILCPECSRVMDCEITHVEPECAPGKAVFTEQARRFFKRTEEIEEGKKRNTLNNCCTTLAS